MDNMGINVGVSLEAVVLENQIKLPEGSNLIPVAVDLRGAIPAGRVSFSVTAKPEIGVVYYHRGARAFLYNFAVQPFVLRKGEIVHRGSLHPMQFKTFECATCGMRVDMDREEEAFSRKNDRFYCSKCVPTAGKVPLKLVGTAIPAGDAGILGSLNTVAETAPSSSSDLLPRIFGVFRAGTAPGSWTPSTPLESEAASRAAASDKGAKELRPVGQLMTLQGPLPGIIELIGVAYPVAVGWIPENDLRVDDSSQLGFKRLFPLDDAGQRYARRAAEPRVRREDALI